MTTENRDHIEEGVAVIGLAARMPGAENAEQYWDNLRNGVESITFFSDEELTAMGVPAATLKDPNYVKGRGILPIPPEEFDAAFFGYNPREAEIIDPQQRWFLETAWEALENSGYSPDTYKGRIGAFAGSGGSQYLYSLQSNPEVGKFATRLSLATSNEKDYLATRVSYKLNLRGPSLTVQTACSTSLVATTLACTSLLNYQSDMAIAGGVSIRVPTGAGYMYQEGGILSPDGHCRTFDAKAQGTTFSAGVGAVVLKRLSDAIADGDHIYAVIRGAAMNNDGNAKAGYTAPGVDGQAEVAAEALALAGIEPSSVEYVETHGTATNVGDPIEIAALTRAYAAGTTKKGFCAVGSVKSNIGHTDAAAGVAGLIKTVLSLKNEVIVPSLFFETPNPHIDFENSPFYVNTKLREWKRNGKPRRAAVSSFGIGGTNAHVVLEEAPEIGPSGPSRDRQLILLSARTETALDKLTSNLAEWLKKNEDASFADVAFTLKAGRRSQTHRRMLVCRDAADAITALETRDPKRIFGARADAQHRSATFLFPGQGAQYAGMARGLYESETLFRELVDRCAEVLTPHLGLDIRTLLFAEGDAVEAAGEQLTQTWLTQPALFVIEYALARLWMQWGLVPEAMIGHSIGEYAAACVAGVLSLDDALALVAARGRLIQQLPGGSMIAVPANEADLLPLITDGVSLAAVNAPGLCVVSGTHEAIAAFEAVLAGKKITARKLHTSHAFHSAMMDPILEPFRAVLRKVRFSAPTIPYISNVTGTWITEAEATDPEYYVRHLRGAVRFSDGMAELLREPSRVLIEAGPGRTLSTFARQQPQEKPVPVVASLRHPQEATGDLDFLLNSLGSLWLEGAVVDWDGFYAGETRHRIPVPTYPFERQHYWISSARTAPAPAAESLDKLPSVTDWFSMPSWKRAAAPPAAATENRRWLVFSDDILGDDVAAALRARGEDVVTVTNDGPVFAKMDTTAYVMRMTHRDDYTSLFDSLAADSRIPTNIIHCGGITTAQRTLEESTEAGFYGLIHLAQALSAKNVTHDVRIDFVANGLYEVASGERIDPAKALAIGPCKVIPQELPNVMVRTIDVRTEDVTAAVRQIVIEAMSASTDRAVAWRGKYRWTQAYENVRLENANGSEARLRQEGVYLITGGFGGIGLVLAQQLAETCNARLALTARGALPARASWTEWLDAHAADDAASVRIRAIQDLEAKGAVVLPLAADASDRAQMKAAVDETIRTFGRIDGVVHAAGVAGGGIIPLKTRAAADRVLDPKTKGTLILDELVAGQQLDFFILCSSLTAVVGAVGQVDYCAANAFMDAFAHQRSLEHPETLTVAVNWDAWEEVGMAVNPYVAAPVAAAPALPEGEPTGHPLLQRRVVEGDTTTYITQFESSHWILDEHRIKGNGTLVGTAYLEIARAAAQLSGKVGPVEIRDLYFLTPLMLAENEKREMRVTLEKRGDGFDFKVRSRTAGTADARWTEHSMGRVVDAPHAAGALDVVTVTGRCDESEILFNDEVSDGLTVPSSSGKLVVKSKIGSFGGYISFGPRWRSLERIHVGRNETLAAIELPADYASDLEALPLHPAMVDVATSFAKQNKGAGFYLPFSYKRVAVHAPLTRKIYSHARFRDESMSAGEVITFDITISDESGRTLVDIEGFSMKKVPETFWAAKSTTDAPAKPVAAPARPGVMHIVKDGILSSEGVDAFLRILASDGMPQVAVSTREINGRIGRANARTQARILEDLDKKTIKSSHPRPDVRTAYVEPRNDLETGIAEIWQSVIGIEKVGIYDNFLELGGHSLLAIQVLSRMREAFQVDLPVESLFKAPTVAELADLIVQKLAEGTDADTLAAMLAELENVSDEEARQMLANN